MKNCTQFLNTIYFGDHNYLMTGLLVSQPPFCTHDLAVNNSAREAEKVGPTETEGALKLWRQDTEKEKNKTTAFSSHL